MSNPGRILFWPNNVNRTRVAGDWRRWERGGVKTAFPPSHGSRSAVDDRQHARDGSLQTTAAAEKALSVVMLVKDEYRNMVFSPELIFEIEEIAGAPAVWVDPDCLPLGRKALAETDVIFSTWGVPLMDAAFLDGTPNLKAVFYAAGSPKPFATPEMFARGIVASTAQSANAIPVIEFSTGVILLSLKRVWMCMRETHRDRSWNKPEYTVAGAYNSTIGLVSLGVIGRGVAKVLARYDLKVLAYDPYASQADAAELGVELVSLERLFAESDVVSLHAPLMPATTGMIGADLLGRMKTRATLVNTARGGIVRQEELCDVLRLRPDLSAVLDVTEPEPPEFDSPLWDLPNVFLTPHSSGSLGGECRRMARFMVDEFRRYTRGIPLMHQLSPDGLDLKA